MPVIGSSSFLPYAASNRTTSAGAIFGGCEVAKPNRQACLLHETHSEAGIIGREAMPWTRRPTSSHSWIARVQRDSTFPDLRDIEAHPIAPISATEYGATLTPNGLAAGGGHLLGIYVITADAYTPKELERLSQLGQNLATPAKGTAAERFARGLGWLTRGRRAADPATRFLAFFTAIECILTTSDKTAPVVQTIARYAACILAREMAARANVAKDLSDLYEVRSKLVHSGDRRVSQTDSMQLHYWQTFCFIECSMPLI